MGGRSSSLNPRSMKREIVLPKPATASIYEGVSISGSTACTTGDCTRCAPGDNRTACCKPCTLIVPANVSSSSVNISLVESGPYSAKTKAIIRPSIPFQISYNGRREVIETLTLYHPSPVRIENVQHDAVLSIGDPSFGDKVIVLIPIISSSSGRESAEFISRIGAYVTQLVSQTTTPKQVSVPTGADWNLTKIIPVGQRSVASGSFFTWNSATLEQYVVSDTPFLRTLGWKATRGPQYILMNQPIQANPTDLQSILTLPATDPASAIHPLGSVLYKSAPPQGCKTCGPSPSQVLKQVKRKKGAGSLSPGTISQIIMWVFIGLAMLWGLSKGLTWALDKNTGAMLKRWGQSIANSFGPRKPLSANPPRVIPQ